MVRSLVELKNEVQNEITNNNRVEAIICKTYKTLQDKSQNLYTIPKSQDVFQELFFQMKNKYSDFFADFIFDESGVTPFSDELDSVLFRLETSTILPALNPSYKAYNITSSLKVLEASYEKLKGQKDIIDSCAKIFSDWIISKAE
jgi:hypothetical protein